MKIVRNSLLVVLLLVITYRLEAQYFQYSQYNFTQQRVNPAQVGLTRYATAATDFRHQKTGGDFAINSNFLSLTYPLLNSSTGQPWSGIGLAFHNDQSAGIFRTQEAAISYAIHVRMSRFQTLSIGMKGLFQTRSISLDGFYTGSQYVPDRGFNTGASNGETAAEFRNSTRTFSTGVNWQEVDKRGRLLRQLGFSLFDFNKPVDSFMGNASTLSSTFVFSGSFQAYTSSDTHVFPEGLLTYSASKAVLTTGLRWQKELNSKSKTLSDRIEVLTKYALGRSGIIGIQLHRENFSMGVSYDFPVIRTNAGNLGALEVALELRKLVSTRAQKLTARRKKEADEKKKLQAQKAKTTIKPSPTKVRPDTLVSTTPQTPDTTQIAPVEIVTSGSIESKPEAEAKAGPIKQEPLLVEKVTLHFPFEFNSADLDDESTTFLQDLTNTLKENPYLKIRIYGHTDNIGSDHFNLHLSHRRADAVKKLLMKSGVDPSRITTEGKGKREPLNENRTDQERAKNRRVEILIYN